LIIFIKNNKNISYTHARHSMLGDQWSTDGEHANWTYGTSGPNDKSIKIKFLGGDSGDCNPLKPSTKVPVLKMEIPFTQIEQGLMTLVSDPFIVHFFANFGIDIALFKSRDQKSRAELADKMRHMMGMIHRINAIVRLIKVEDLISVFSNQNCRIPIAQQICDERLKDGIYINSSLEMARYVMRRIIKARFKSRINMAPPFVDGCMGQFCSGTVCFNNATVETRDDNGSIFKTLAKMLGNTKLNESELVLCVFCVLNISKNASNPPPVPYLDINELKYHADFSTHDTFRKACIDWCDRTKKEFIDFIPDVIKNSAFSRLKGTAMDTASSHYHLRVAAVQLFKLVDTSNAASTMGTLEYTDAMAKLNITDRMCVDVLHQDYNKDFKFVNMLA
jgi:hypothetical protein